MRVFLPLYYITNKKRPQPNVVMQMSPRGRIWRCPVFTSPTRLKAYQERQVSPDVDGRIVVIKSWQGFSLFLQTLRKQASWLKWMIVNPSPFPRRPKRDSCVEIKDLVEAVERHYGD